MTWFLKILIVTTAFLTLVWCASTPPPAPYEPSPLPVLSESEQLQHSTLIDAIKNQDWKTFALFEQSSAPIYHRDQAGKTPYQYAMEISETDESRRYIRRIFSRDMADPFLDLHGGIRKDLYIAAVVMRNTNAVKRAIDRGADINQTDVLGRTVLHHAVFQANVEMVELLISEGINQNIRDHFGYTDSDHKGGTALCYAAQRNDFDDGLRLLAENRDALGMPCYFTPFSDSWSHTPLTLAISSRTFEPIPFTVSSGQKQALILLDAGAPIEVDPLQVHTLPLIAASFGGQNEVITDLLRRGANPLARSFGKDGVPKSTAMTAAITGGRLDTIKLLLEADPRTANLAAYKSRRPLHAALLAQNVNGENISSSQQEALTRLRITMIRELLKAGANPNATEIEGNTPLHWAIRTGALSSAVWLIESVDELKISIVNDEGYDALSLAHKMHRQGACDCSEVIQLLEERR